MDKFNEIIDNAHNIFVTSHIKPDWDAVASVLAMQDYLVKKYPEKNTKVFLNGNKNPAFDLYSGYEKINWIRDISDVINEYDVVIFLDGNLISRFSREPEKIDLTRYKSICIDHHLGAADAFDVNLSDTTQASAAQLVYRLFHRNNPEYLDKELAENILRGIIGDTGTFKYINTERSDTLLYVKELLDVAQTDIQILELPMVSMTLKEFDLLQILMKNTANIEIDGVPPLSYSYIPISVLEKGYTSADIRNVGEKYKTTILRQIQGHNWGFIVSPVSQGQQVSASFRSTSGLVDVRDLAANFGGGGHLLAAGAEINIDGEKYKESIDVCNMIIEFIKNNKVKTA